MHIVLVFFLIIVVTFIRLSFSTKGNRKMEVFWAGLLIFIFAALRDQSVGVDLPRYSDNFIEIASWSVSDILNYSSGYSWSRDPVFWVFMKFLTEISLNPQIMIVAISAIVAVSVSILIYRSKSDVLLCFIIFISLRYFSFTLTGLRQAVAISVLFFAYKYLKTKKFFPFIVVVIIASAFHKSAFVFVLAYPIMLIEKTKYIFIFSSLFLILSFAFKGFVLLIISFIPFFENRFNHYLEMSNGGSGSVIFAIYFVIVFFLLINHNKIRNYILKITIGISQIKQKDLKEANSTISMYYNFLIVGTTLSYVGIFLPNIFRIAYFFIIPSLFFLLPKIISYSQNVLQLKPLKFIVIFLLLFQYFVIGPGAGTGEYVFFWE